MVREGKRSITVDEETFNEMERRKDEGETWDEFLIRAAKIIDPAPHIDGSQLPIEDHEWMQLTHLSILDGVELYRHKNAGYFTVTPEEQEYRRTRRALSDLGFEARYVDRHKDPEIWKLGRDKENILE